MRYGLQRTTDAATEPVTTAEAKTHLRITGTDDDTYIGNAITAARQLFEDRTNRAVISQTLSLSLDGWFAYELIKTRWLYLPRSPLSSVTSVYYRSTDGTNTLWASTNYLVDTVSEPGRLALAPNVMWPVTQSDRINSVVITYVAGFANAAAVPLGIKQAILVILADMYEHRESESYMPNERLLTPWMIGDNYFEFGGVA